MTAPSQRRALGDRWTSRVGAWVGLGASPGALVLGAGIASRHDGPAPLVALVLATVAMGVLLWSQGRLGLVPPVGEARDLGALAKSYFTAATRRTVGWLLAASMVGWFGFNAGLGGGALSAILRAPSPVGPVALGIGALLLARGGIPRWNAFAVIATASSLLLVTLLVVRLPAGGSPVTLRWPPGGFLALDVAAYMGYVAVFSVRAPDFTVGLRRRADLGWSIVVLCAATLPVSLVGVAIQRATGAEDVVAVLAGQPGLALGNALVTVAVLAPMLTALHSGALAMRSAAGVAPPVGMGIVVAAGVALGILRFDRHLLFWLSLLAAALPPVIVPVAVERRRRRRGRRPRTVPVWVWGVPAAPAAALAVVGHPLATATGLGGAVLLTLVWAAASEDAPEEVRGTDGTA